ncbi:MAG: AAA family ATPase, partial [Armatimonadota bacterium]
MILREITVKGVKCFRDECRVGSFGDGLNMIFGPNETGKSTLIEATARALFDDYSSKAESIKQLQPWNTTLAPEIILEFVAESDEYRLTKRLLADTLCRLERHESGGWSALHERDAADDFVRGLLHGEGAHGASDLRHWGIARTLWCLNDPCMIGKGDASCVVPGAVAGQIRSVLGEGTVATALDAVCAQIDARYETHFTARRGDPRAGSKIAALREELAQLEQDRSEAEAALREVEEAAGRLEGIEAELGELERERERWEAQIAEYRDEAAEIEALQREIADVEQKLERARSDRDEIRGDLERFVEARDVAEEARADLRSVQDALDDLEADLKAAQQLAAEAEEEHAQAREARQEASRKRERGRKVEEAQSLLEERDSLTERLAEIEELRGKSEELERRLQAMPHPENAQIERADSLERQIERLHTQLEAAGLTVTVEALREQEVAIEGGEDSLREAIDAGGEVEYT